MAEDSGLEKTEPASQKRLDKAREDGDVPRSRELSTCTILFAAGAGLWFNGDALVRGLERMIASGLALERAEVFDSSLLLTRLGAAIGDVLLAFAPVALLLILVAIASPVLIGGWVFSAKAITPDFLRLNPLRGLGNMFSSHAAVELGKAIGKTLLVGSVAAIVIWHEKDAVITLALEPVAQGTAHLGSLLWTSFAGMAAALLLIAMVDAPYQMWRYAKKLMMTRQELRQEARESEGDPQIKAKIRAQQREMARRRMMAAIPTADVVVTNPTHYAVALQYLDEASGRAGARANGAPRVVAKGAGEMAQRIRALALANNVPLLEAPPLARALYRHTELDDQIPEALYKAVAEVLAYVFQLRSYRQRGGVRPEAPKDLDVPPQLDPESDSKAPVGAGAWELVL